MSRFRASPDILRGRYLTYYIPRLHSITTFRFRAANRCRFLVWTPAEEGRVYYDYDDQDERENRHESCH
jgi:hypothetical protein